jgi:putative inorganic carbon (HCO3(-)) transporter
MGFSYSFVAGLAYVWIDIVKPQDLAYSIINTLPVSMIASVVTLLSFLAERDKKPFKFTAVMFLLCFFGAWMTFTAFNADPRILPWVKWDWAFKVMVFTVFIPMIFRSRVHLEALILTILFSVATVSFSAGVKTALGSGGYGVLAIMGGGNAGLSESSTLAAICVMQLPLLHYVYNHSILFPGNRWFKLLVLLIATSTILAIIGTSARTGLIASGVLMALYFLRSKRKLVWCVAFAIALGALGTLDLKDTAWGSRMSTIESFDKESSAAGRLKVWEWTLGFVADNPLGGGFDAYKLNRIASVSGQGDITYYEPGIFNGKAFHSINFEVLGEQGIVGFVVYISIMALTFLRLRRIRIVTRHEPELAWANDMALKLGYALAALMVSGFFIGIAYQPYMFYLVAMTVSLGELLLHGRPSIKYAKENVKNGA